MIIFFQQHFLILVEFFWGFTFKMNDGKFSVNKASKRENVRPPTNIIDDSRAILGIKSSKRNSQILDSEMNPYLRDLGLEKKQFQSAV